MNFLRTLFVYVYLSMTAYTLSAQTLPELMPYYSNGLWGFSDRKKNIVIPCQYDKVEFFKSGVAIVHGNCKMEYPYGKDVGCCMVCKRGVIDATGNLIIPIEYDNIKDFNEKGIAKVYRDGMVGLLNKNGKEILPFIYRESYLKEIWGFTKIALEGKFGLIDKEGKFLLPVRYDEIETDKYINHSQMEDWRVIKIKSGNKWGFYSPQNNIIVEPIFDEFILNRYSMQEKEKFLYSQTAGEVELWDKKSGRKIISGRYDDIKILSEGKFFELIIQNKKGLADRSGKIIVPVQFDHISIFNNYKFIQATGDKNIDFFNLSGKNIRKNFDRIENLSEYATLNIFKIFQKNGKWGLLDSIGKKIIQAKFDTLIHQRDINAIITLQNGKYGLFDKKGKEIVACQYDLIKPYYGYYRNLELSKAFVVSKDGKKGLINYELRKEVIPCEYDHINNFFSGSDPEIFEVRKDGEIGAINNLGQIIFPPHYKTISENSHQGYFVVQNHNNETGITNMQGKFIIPMEYEGVLSLNAPFILKKHGKYGLVDSLTQKPLTEFKFDHIDLNAFSKSDVAKTRIDTKRGVVNRYGLELAPCEYEEVEIVNQLLFVRNQNKKWGVINLQGELIYNFVLDSIDKSYWYKKDIPIQLDGKWGILNNNGKLIIKPKFGQLKFVYNSPNIEAVLENKWGILDSVGQVIIPLQFDELKYLKNGFIKVKYDGLWGLKDSLNQEILPNVYEEIEILDDASDDRRALPYKSAYVKIKKEKGWGLIHINNKRELIPSKYHNVYVLSDNLFIAYDKYRRVFYNSQGEVIGNLDDENVMRYDDWTINEFYNMLYSKDYPLILLEKKGYIDLYGNIYSH